MTSTSPAPPPPPPPLPPAAPRPESLLSLNGDLLRHVANMLPPSDRVALSHTSKTLFTETWGQFGLDDLLARFPLEQRITFALSPHVSDTPPLRVVPDRTAQQHVYAAVTSDGRLAAILPYDNVLRLVNVRSGSVLHTPLAGPALYSDVWDLSEGFRRPTSGIHAGKRYADRAAVDAEATLEFSHDGSLLVLSCTRFAHIYAVGPNGFSPGAHLDAARVLDAVRTTLPAPGAPGDCAAGAAALSPDGRTLAWVMFYGFPARAVLTLWRVDEGARSATWTSYTPLGELGLPSGSALAWVRPTFHEAYVAVAVNTTRRMLRTERVGDAFRRSKLCRFRFAAVPLGSCADAAPALLEPAAERSAWLALTAGLYPAALAAQLRAVVADAGAEEARASVDASRVRMNCVHTSPSEATYKALAFGDKGKHPWFVAKQPLYSLHFCEPPPHASHARRKAQRVLVAGSAHDNSVIPLEWVAPAEGAPPIAANVQAGAGGDEAAAQPVPGRFEETSVVSRRFAFRGLPWRAAFASVSAFAPGGRWVVGAALKTDVCFVCVRNITNEEYYGTTE